MRRSRLFFNGRDVQSANIGIAKTNGAKSTIEKPVATEDAAVQNGVELRRTSDGKADL